MVNSPFPRVLILRDEPATWPELVSLMPNAGYEVSTTAAPGQALSWMTDEIYDVIIIDLDTPDLDGPSFMQAARGLQPDLQIVVMTSRPALLTAIAAIRAGAADYLIKPIEPHIVMDSVGRALESLSVLKSQLSRLVREAGKTNAESKSDHDPGPNGTSPGSMIIVPPFRLDYAHRRVTILGDSNQTIDLSRGETAMLACLMSNPDRPLTTSQIARLAWNYDLDPAESADLVRPYIHRLRRKLESDPGDPRLIVTARGLGYLFVPERSLPASGQVLDEKNSF